MRIKVSEDFYLDEFVCPELYQSIKEQSFWYIDEKIINIVQYIRSVTGKPVIINTWFKNSRGYKYRGLRPFDSNFGANLSLHKIGKAVDFDVEGYTSKQVREMILGIWKNDLMNLGLTAIETNVRWVHIDVRNTRQNEILLIP